MKKIILYFDAKEHKYTDNEGNVYTSATTLLGNFGQQYNKKFWSMYRALEESGHKIRPDLKNESILIYKPNSLFDKWKPYSLDDLYNSDIELKRKPNVITNEWKSLADIACNWGNERHNYLEDCINAFYEKQNEHKFDISNTKNNDREGKQFRFKITNKNELENSPLKDTHESVYTMLFDFISKGFVLYAEKRIYSYKYKISGTIDVLAVRGLDFYIIDWKTNKDELVFKSGYFKKVWNKNRTRKIKTKQWISTNDRFKNPISGISYCKGNLYTLQLSLYAYLCELWGLRCLGLILCHIRHNETIKDTYKIISGVKVHDGIEVKKVEKAPRIYNDIKYMKDSIEKLFDYHYRVTILKQNINSVNSSALRGPVNA